MAAFFRWVAGAWCAGFCSVAAAAIEPTGCETAWLAQPVTQGFDYDNDIQPIWDQFCANCHVSHAGMPLGGLDLDPPFSLSNLVGAPSSDLSLLLVAPGDPLASLLWRKVNCDSPGPRKGDGRMPFARPPLSAALQARIFDWIAAGAPQLLDRVFANGMEPR